MISIPSFAPSASKPHDKAAKREQNPHYTHYNGLTQLSFEARAQLKNANLPPEIRAAIEERLRWAERNLGERYHAGVENKCQDILDSLRSESDILYHDDVRCVDFLYFLSLQYFRTAKMREGLSNIPSYVPGHDPHRTATVLNHIHATNVGAGLYRERKTYRIVFLRNGTAIPFIAGDQPVINMLDPKATVLSSRATAGYGADQGCRQVS